MEIMKIYYSFQSLEKLYNGIHKRITCKIRYRYSDVGVGGACRFTDSVKGAIHNGTYSESDAVGFFNKN